MFVHHVLFWLKDPENTHHRSLLLKGLMTLEQIEPKVNMHVGIPAATSRAVIDTSYSFSLLLIFESAEDEAAYQVHPIHLKFVEEYSQLWSKVQIYDSIEAASL